jgi:hypothetical protein
MQFVPIARAKLINPDYPVSRVAADAGSTLNSASRPQGLNSTIANTTVAPIRAKSPAKIMRATARPMRCELNNLNRLQKCTFRNSDQTAIMQAIAYFSPRIIAK